VSHSEFNPSRSLGLHFLQIWIEPKTRGLQPSYTEWHPDPSAADSPKVLMISPDGREESALIHQDSYVYRIRLARGQEATHSLAPGRGVWIQVARGSLSIDGTKLAAGDGASTEDAGKLTVSAVQDAEALLFDLG